MPQPASLLKKRNSGTGVFLWILRNWTPFLTEHLFLQISYRTPTLTASICTKSIYLPLYCQPVQFVMQFRYAILLAVWLNWLFWKSNLSLLSNLTLPSRLKNVRKKDVHIWFNLETKKTSELEGLMNFRFGTFERRR